MKLECVRGYFHRTSLATNRAHDAPREEKSFITELATHVANSCLPNCATGAARNMVALAQRGWSWAVRTTMGITSRVMCDGLYRAAVSAPKAGSKRHSPLDFHRQSSNVTNPAFRVRLQVGDVRSGRRTSYFRSCPSEQDSLPAHIFNLKSQEGYVPVPERT